MQKGSEQINRIKVEINGEDYYIKGTAPEEYIKQVASYVDKKMKNLSQSHPNLSRNRVAVLAALNITDELFKLKKEYEEFLSMVDGESRG
ncbi:cell division protein ZapA [Thermoanaerobacterium sp. DL9XJH110]|uniref:cell division protein ZapA n=1 Tax=Thermoanaerobacterium sp. DL9XJH110 TaxID=3386643 RepID=UPI003BB55975